MKKLIMILMLYAFHSSAQTSKDTVRLDTTRVETINRFPVDTVEYNMPVAPLGDTTGIKLKHDDADPARRKRE
jgi:hypothetical protein